MVLLCCCCCQVGEIKAWFALGALQQPCCVQLRLQKVGEYRDGGHGGELRRKLGKCAAGESQRLVAEGPLLKMDGMKSTEAVDALKMIRWQLETSGGLDEGTVGQLKGWMKRDGGW